MRQLVEASALALKVENTHRLHHLLDISQAQEQTQDEPRAPVIQELIVEQVKNIRLSVVFLKQ